MNKISRKIKKHKKTLIGLVFLLSVIFCVFALDVRIGFTVFENIETMPSSIVVLSVFMICLVTVIVVVIVMVIYDY